MLVTICALFLTGILAFPGLLPDWPGHLGSLVETALPWFGLLIPPLLIWALLRRSRKEVAVVMIPVVAWVLLLCPRILDVPGRNLGHADFQVLTVNVGGDRTSPRDVARQVQTTGADLVALEKVPGQAMAVYEKELHALYPHHAAGDTLGLWSRYPLSGIQKLDLGGAWPHAIRAVARTPLGDTAVYAVRLPSARVALDKGFTVQERDASAERLGKRVAEDHTPRVVLLGDLNGSLDDRGLAPLTDSLRSTQEQAGTGFGFTWPASFPMVRLDHVLVRGLEATDSTVLPDLGSDHRPVVTGLRAAR